MNTPPPTLINPCMSIKFIELGELCGQKWVESPSKRGIETGGGNNARLGGVAKIENMLPYYMYVALRVIAIADF